MKTLRTKSKITRLLKGAYRCKAYRCKDRDLARVESRNSGSHGSSHGRLDLGVSWFRASFAGAMVMEERTQLGGLALVVWLKKSR